jgi:fatty acid synthase
MSTGKHMGKVLIEVRAIDTPLLRVRAAARALPHPHHAYIITGGLGGFGLELAQWLVNRGASR